MIPIPRFNQGTSKRATEKFNSPAEALQEFCQDCLRCQYTNFYVFPTLGRDGAIDGIQINTWAECKICSEDKAKAIIQKWKETEKSLREQLSKGENKCQKQYKPWFSSESPIREYILFTNASLPNNEAEREVKKYIKNVFSDLSRINTALTHLKDVKIEIWHWRRIVPIIRENTNLLYSWFWESWPPGMTPSNIEQKGGFRSYLHSSKLPYFSLTNFEKISGEKSPIITENNIINSFSETNKIGKIIIGPAGVGKTRMALQIGELARQDEWIVFLVNASSVPLSSIGQLFEGLKESDKVLLIIDYVELMEHFKGFAEEINNYNNKYGKKVFYIATVRQSYYYRVLSDESTHECIKLDIDPLNDWMIKYMEKVVSHILETSKIPQYKEYIPICKNIPVLAVLVVYLYQNVKTTDIKDILEAKDFGVWFSKHLKLTLPFTEDSLVAKFMLCLPMSERMLERLPSDFEIIKNKLSTDGWIESPKEINQKRYAIHDVISDRVVISYCYSIRPEVKSFVKKAFEFAREYNSLGSVLVAFERIIDCEPLSGIDFHSLITNEMTKHPIEWRPHRIRLLITSLLDESQQIMLLGENKDYWNDLFAESSFHQAIGWLIGWLAREENQSSQRIISLRNILEPFIAPILVNIKNNYVICRALELWPDKYCKQASEWLEKNMDDSKISYILSAYIRSSRYDKDIEKELTKWFNIHSTDYESYHVLRALFGVGRTSPLETNWFKNWLSTNVSSPKARKLIILYLENGSKFYYLKDLFIKNIKDQKEDSIRHYWIVYWIDYADEIKSIEQYILDITYDKNPETFNYIYKILPFKKFKLSQSMVKNCLIWCKKNIDNSHVLWNLNKLIWKNFDISLIEDFIEVLEKSLQHIHSMNLSEDDCSNINCSIYKLLKKTYKNNTRYLRILNCFLESLREDYSFTRNINVYTGIQDTVFFLALVEMLKKGMLKIDNDYEKILKFMKWFGRWDSQNKDRVERQLNFLRYKFPSDLWDSV